MNQKRTTLSRKHSLKATLCAMTMSVLLVASPVFAFADTAAEKQAEAQAAYESLCEMQQQLDIASNNYSEALFELDAAKQRMEECQSQIDEKTKEIKELQEKLSSRARSMYRSGGNTFIDVLVDSSSFEEFAGNMDMLIELNDQDAKLVANTKEARETLEAAKVEYAEQERVAQEKTDEAARIKDEAEATVAEIQALYDNLSEEAEKLLEEERKAAEEEAARQAAAVVEASAADGGEYQQSAESQEYQENGGNQEATSEPESSGATYGGGGDTVSRAQACLGAPYSWGACGPGAFDCSGLVSYALTGSYSRLGTTNTFMGWSQVSDPQPGDICTSSYHCGIYIGGGQMIHAADYGIGVIVGPVQSDMIIVRW